MDWDDLTRRSLDRMDRVDDVYRPTTFWGPGVRSLLAEMDEVGLESFKSWESARFWFYPRYPALDDTTVETLLAAARDRGEVNEAWLRGALTARRDARRDLDMVRQVWNQRRWPFSVDHFGESTVGDPPQHWALLNPDGPRWTKPYLNYLLCLALLSRHAKRPLRSFVEIGGGYGVLGEILLSRYASARYVDLDIPPLLTVAGYYLRTLFGDRVHVDGDGAVGPSGSSAVLPNWAVRDLDGPFDAFVNSFSFQEMEPHVVRHYVDAVCDLGIEYAVSLNSRLGKPRAQEGRTEPGVVEPVTSQTVLDLFAAHGFAVVARRQAPLLVDSAGELVVLRRG